MSGMLIVALFIVLYNVWWLLISITFITGWLHAKLALLASLGTIAYVLRNDKYAWRTTVAFLKRVAGALESATTPKPETAAQDVQPRTERAALT